MLAKVGPGDCMSSVDATFELFTEVCLIARVHFKCLLL